MAYNPIALTSPEAAMLLTAANDNAPPATGFTVACYIATRATYSAMLVGLAYWVHGLPG